MNKRLGELFATALVTAIVLSAMPMIMPAPAASLLGLWVAPDQVLTEALVGYSFNETVYAGIVAGEKAFTWQVNITWDPTLLNVTAAHFTAGAHSAWLNAYHPMSLTPVINNVHGEVDAGETLLAPNFELGPSSGSLITITFKVISAPGIGENLTCEIGFGRTENFILDPTLSTIPGLNKSPATYVNAWAAPLTHPQLEMVNMTTNTFDWLHNWTSPPLPSPYTFIEKITIDNLDVTWFLNNITIEWDYNCSLLSLTDVTFDPLWTGHALQNDVSLSPNGNLTLEADAPSHYLSGNNILVASIVCQILTQAEVPPEPRMYYDDSPRLLTLVSAVSAYNSIGKITFRPQAGDTRPIQVYAYLDKVVYQHDVAVVTVASSKTVVGQGFTANLHVDVTNLGDYTETFNVTTYANATVTGTEETAALPNVNSAMTFTWNTTGFAYANYTLSAYALPVPGETETADNNCTGGWVIVSVVGDITGPTGQPDGLVDMWDVGYVASRFLAEPGKPLWDTNADINNDLIIDMADVGLAAAHFLQQVP